MKDKILRNITIKDVIILSLVILIMFLSSLFIFNKVNKEESPKNNVQFESDKESTNVIDPPNDDYINDMNLISINDFEFKNDEEVEKKTKKVLVIEIDPYLKSKGKKVSDFLDQSNNVNTMISNLKNDITYGSNGNIIVDIIGHEKLNEFPTYKEKVKLINGKYDNRFDEETYLSVFNNGWYGWWSTNNEDFQKLDREKLFDYEYIISKFDLVNRRNKNEFDEVWMISVDPSSAYETIMVGRSAYWINGAPIIKECDNFVIAGFAISRVDSPLECLAHATENIMSEVFGTRLEYTKDYMDVDSSNYNELNLWQKFTLTEYSNKNKGTKLSGVGNVHFTPNSTKDYDWLNDTYIESNWIDWKNNYPNLKGETSLVNYKTWNKEKDLTYNGRYYHRWWFSLMPHVGGITKDGYSNNWWEYLYSFDFVTSISDGNEKYKYTYNVGDKINDITVKEIYQSGKQESTLLDKYKINMTFKDSSLFKINSDGEIIAVKEGTTILNYFKDGRKLNIVIEIK